MSEKQWYEDLSRDEYEGKHVRVVVDSGTVVEGRLKLWDSKMVVVCMGSLDDGIYVLKSIDNCWCLMGGIESLDLVWDERDWERIDVRDVRHGDAVVVNGRFCTVDKAWPDDYHPQVVTVAPSRMRIDLCLVSCALRRKAKVPVKPGFYKDRTGAYWVRSFILDIDKPWRAVDSYAFDSPVRSEEEMLTLMPLTPVHFESGRAA